MDIVTFKDIVIGIAAVLAAALAIWNFFQSPSKKNAGAIESLGDALAKLRADTATEINDVDDKVNAVSGRVSTLETVIKHMPDKDSMHRLELNLERVSGQMIALNDKLGSVEHLSRRLQNMMVGSKAE